MPMYQYTCQTCGQGFEKQLRMSESSATQSCPACGSRETRKRLGAIAVNAGTRMSTAVSTPPPTSRFT